MFDFDLQTRFWRGVTDAMMHNTDAMLAASKAWQDEALTALTKAEEPGAAVAKQATGVAAWPTLNSQSGPQSTSITPMWWLGPSWLQNAGMQNPWQQMATQMMAPLLGQPARPAPSAMNPFGLNMFAYNPFAANAAFANPFAAMNPFLSATPWMDMFWEQSMSAWQSPANSDSMLSFAKPSPFANPFAALFPWAVTPWSYMQMPLTTMFMQAGVPYAVASPSAKASTAAMDAAHAAQQQMEKVYSAYRSDGGHAAAQIITLPWTLAASFLTPNTLKTAKPAA